MVPGSTVLSSPFWWDPAGLLPLNPVICSDNDLKTHAAILLIESTDAPCLMRKEEKGISDRFQGRQKRRVEVGLPLNANSVVWNDRLRLCLSPRLRFLCVCVSLCSAYFYSSSSLWQTPLLRTLPIHTPYKIARLE